MQPRTSPPAPLRARLRSIRDRKSTRLNSSHSQISYAVFCLKKKKNVSNENGTTNNESRASMNTSMQLIARDDDSMRTANYSARIYEVELVDHSARMLLGTR